MRCAGIGVVGDTRSGGHSANRGSESEMAYRGAVNLPRM